MHSVDPAPGLYAQKCSKLLSEDEIRFAGIVNSDGKLIAGGFKDGITPHENDETRLQSFLEFVSRVSIRKEHDESLGPINYLAARRDKAVLVSFPFPVTRVLLLISAEPTANIEKLAKKAVDMFTSPIDCQLPLTSAGSGAGLGREPPPGTSGYNTPTKNHQEVSS